MRINELQSIVRARQQRGQYGPWSVADNESTPEQHATQDALAAALAVLKSRGFRAEVTVRLLDGLKVSRDNF